MTDQSRLSDPAAAAAPNAADDGKELRLTLAAGTVAATAAEGAATTAPSARTPAPTVRLVPTAKTVRRAGHLRRIRVRDGDNPEPKLSTAAPGGLVPTSGAGDAPNDTRSELRNWVKDNATLLSNASLLISIAALALTLLPGEGIAEPYIQALLFGAALVLLLELHHQWPEELQLLRGQAPSMPAGHSWRMAGFAYLLQFATFLFVIWAVLTTPLILFPLTAFGVVLLFRRFFFRRFGGRFARAIGVLSLILALLLSEVLMLVVWAAVTGEQVTIQLWVDEREELGVGLSLNQ
jgi:hypothetical protein